MKCETIISALASLLLCSWYLTAIVGLDIHVDHHDGEIYVVSLLADFDCESLHPEDECHCIDHHHGHHHGLCHSEDNDCENDISVLSLTGDGFDFVCDLTPFLYVLMSIETPVQIEKGFANTFSSPICEDPPRELLRSLCVLRV